MKDIRHMEPRTVALLLSFAVGLGMAVHAVFFVVAVAIALVAVTQAMIDQKKSTQRHA